MKCNKCGKEMGDGFKFCKYCGTPMEEPCPQETAGTGTRKKSKIPLVILLVVAVLALAGGGGFFLLKMASGSHGEKEKEASTETDLHVYQCENDYNLASDRLEHIKTDHYYCHIELPAHDWYEYEYRSKIKIPIVLTESEWEAMLQKLSKEQQNLLSGYAYKRYDINSPGKKDDIEALKAKYPIYENQVIYVLRDGVGDNILRKVEQYLEEAGCTEEMWEYNNSLEAENGAPEKEYLVIRYYDFETMKPVAQAEITMYIRSTDNILPYRDHLIVVGWDNNNKYQLFMIDGSSIRNLKNGEEPKIIQLNEEAISIQSYFEMNVVGDTLYYRLDFSEGWTTIDLSKY